MKWRIQGLGKMWKRSETDGDEGKHSGGNGGIKGGEKRNERREKWRILEKEEGEGGRRGVEEEEEG